MPNASSPAPISQEDLKDLIPKFVVYAIQGFVLTVLNSLILAAIVRYKDIRKKKEFIILGALAFTDILNGVACLLAGVLRIVLIREGNGAVLVTRWSCFMTPWNLTWVFWMHTYSITLFTVSLDRFIALASPLKYYGYDQAYAYKLLALTHLPPLGLCVFYLAQLHSSIEAPSKPAICYTSWIFDKQYYYYNNLINTTFATLSVALFVIVVCQYQKHKGTVAASNSAGAQQFNAELKRQRQLTETVFLSCVFTFTFHVLPLLAHGIVAVLDSRNSTLSVLFSLTKVIQNLNSALNFPLYTSRLPDFAEAIKGLFCCKSDISQLSYDNVTLVRTQAESTV